MFKLFYPQSGNFFYATKSSAGFDISSNQDVTILPGSWKIISTGLYIVESIDGMMEFENNKYKIVPEIQIRSRSGIASNFGVSILGGVSTIDADYRGEIRVTLINQGTIPYSIKKGGRIAQGVCSLTFQAPGVEVKQVERKDNGFGSTG